MTLKQWAENGWLKLHQTTPEEIKNLFQIVDRDLKDSRSGVSADWQFGIAYNAALKLCTILLYAEGYKTKEIFSIIEPFKRFLKYSAGGKLMMQIIWIPVGQRETRQNMILWA